MKWADIGDMRASSRLRKDRSGDERGISSVIELVIVMVVIGVLLGIIIPFFGTAQSNAKDGRPQQAIKTAYSAAGSIYGDVQDYGFFGSSTPTTTGACSTTTSATLNLIAQVKNASITCEGSATCATAIPTNTSPTTVVICSGELSDTNPGGWMGFAALSQTGTCWQMYVPADGNPTYGSTTGSCLPPTSPPSGTSWS